MSIHSMLHPLSCFHRDERGQMAIMLVPTLLIVFMFFALALDAGMWYFDHRWAQTQAEASAAAAIVFLPSADNSDAIAASNLWLEKNGSVTVNDTICPRSGTGNGRQIRDDDGDGRYETVQVCVRRLRLSLFASMSGITSAYVSASATARVEEVPSLYALMAMDEDDCSSLWVRGGATVNITGGGGTYTASTCSSGLRVSGTAELHAGVNDVASGTALTDGGGIIDLPATPQDVLDDPFADLVQPVPTGTCFTVGSITSNTTLSPGCYSNRVNIAGDGTVVRLNPGVYIFEDGLNVGAQSTLTGDVNGNNVLDPTEEVLLYSTCPHPPVPCNGRLAGDISFAGGAQVRLRGVGGTVWQEMVLWTDRTSSPSPEIQIGGNSAALGIEGRIYNWQGVVELAGTGDATLTLNMAIVARNIDMHGDVTFNMPYNPILAPVERRLGLTD